MLKPKALLSLLEKAIEMFPSVKNIFISNPEGYLIASPLISDEDKTYIASFTNIWVSYFDVKLSPDENTQVNLNYAILDYHKGKVALTAICNNLVLGIYTENGSAEEGVLLAEIKLLREHLEPHFKIIFESQENAEYENNNHH